MDFTSSTFVLNFNPLSPHGERLLRDGHLGIGGDISIHSPHTGRDANYAIMTVIEMISIHSPHTGRDGIPADDGTGRDGFQSTLPTRGETPLSYRSGKRGVFQSTLPTRGETSGLRPASCSDDISIHSPHTGRDAAFRFRTSVSIHFNPLSPHGERPNAPFSLYTLRNFNPLSSHGERPQAGTRQFGTAGHFNPLSPHGERRKLTNVMPAC